MMQGFCVDCKVGWDCYGLFVELVVEKEFGFFGKFDIEKYGVELFNVKCCEFVICYVDVFSEFIE